MLPIYEPAEDSYLLSDALKEELPVLIGKDPELKFLEVGCGSGINLQTALKSGIKKENVFGCDINPAAVEHCCKLGFNCIESDLFRNISGGFDLIAFNPPYLPEDEKEPKDSRQNTTAGRRGNELIIKFLKQSRSHLNAGGRIFLITSSLSKRVDFNELRYDAKILDLRNLFFEKLYLWECLKI